VSNPTRLTSASGLPVAAVAPRLSAQRALGLLVTLGGLAVLAQHLLSSLLR